MLFTCTFGFVSQKMLLADNETVFGNCFSQFSKSLEDNWKHNLLILL